jgi:2,4-dienoyl-CoA reductase-like NADH-dependent reductase (Old Yellow Enzyme family)
MSILTSPWSIKDVSFRNRIFMSPMCQYRAENGRPTNWHLVHLGSRAVGGAGLVMVEATGVSPEGRISPWDTGLWERSQVDAFRPIVDFVSEHGAVPGIQIAHAGRKASVDRPWKGGKPLSPAEGGWIPVAPSPIPFNSVSTVPSPLDGDGMEKVVLDFVSAAHRALETGFRVLEIHMAHGYLLNEFLSPLSNARTDEFGGSVENRMRFPMRVAREVRRVWPESYPLFVRISATDWVEGGWTLDDSVVLCQELREIGVDLIDVSSGGLMPDAKVPVAPGYQVPFAYGIRKKVDILVSTVGMITDPDQAESILKNGEADAVSLAKEFLRDPYWAWRAAKKFGDSVSPPPPYPVAWM